MDFSGLDKLVDDLDKCGDTYCGNIITKKEMKEEDLKFLKSLQKNCASKTNPATEQEYNLQRKKYDKCLTQMKTKSDYYKRLTQRKKCEDQKCKIIQDKIKKTLSKPKTQVKGRGKRKSRRSK
jgi:hypothetical protein